MARSMAGPRVLIVGAGIAGLALAACLNSVGIRCSIVEISRASLSRGLALMLTSNVALALRRVGLDGPVIDRGVVLRRMTHIEPSGTPLEEDHDLRWSNERFAPNLGITRDGLMSALASAMVETVRYSTTVTSLDRSAEDVEVTFTDGTRDRFDLVVGADGIDSAVRGTIYPDVQPAYRSFCAWRTVMEAAEVDPVFTLSTTPGSFLGSFPVAPDLVYAFLLAHSPAVPTLTRDQRLERLQLLAAGFRGNVSDLIQRQTDAGLVAFVPVREVETPAYHQGRVLLIGDAAHAFSPLLAQGRQWPSRMRSPSLSCSPGARTWTRPC